MVIASKPNAANVKRIFHLYSYENLTIDGVVEKVYAEGRIWRKSQPTFPRSSVHNILKDRSHDENAELAAKVFELSQTLRSQWLTADYSAKRRILETVFLNCVLDDVTLVPTMRKPFDVLAEGLVSEKSRGDRI